MMAFAKQVGGNHYVTMKMQHTFFASANGYDPAAYSILKYVSRDGRKHEGPVDLEKALHFIDLREDLLAAGVIVPLSVENAKIGMQAYIDANAFEDPHQRIVLHGLHMYVAGLASAVDLSRSIQALRDARYGEAHGKEAKH